MIKKLIIATLCVCTTFSLFENESFGRGGRSSSSRSISRPSRSTPSRSSRPSTPSRLSSSSRPSKTTTPSKPKETPAQKAFREKAVKNGTSFQNRTAAKTSFQNKLKSDPKFKAEFDKKYPTKYDKEPTTRPAHIPSSYEGRPTVFHNGQYGYRDSGGSFMPFVAGMLIGDAMNDSMYRSMGYHIHTPVHHGTIATVYNPYTGIKIVVGLFIMLVIAVSVFSWLSRNS